MEFENPYQNSHGGRDTSFSFLLIANLDEIAYLNILNITNAYESFRRGIINTLYSTKIFALFFVYSDMIIYDSTRQTRGLQRWEYDPKCLHQKP